MMLRAQIVLGNFGTTFQNVSNFSSFEQLEATLTFLKNSGNFQTQLYTINKSCFRLFKTGQVAHILKGCSKVAEHKREAHWNAGLKVTMTRELTSILAKLYSNNIQH